MEVLPPPNGTKEPGPQESPQKRRRRVHLRAVPALSPRISVGSMQFAVHSWLVLACELSAKNIMQIAKKILFLTYPFVVATLFLPSRLRALLLWESERENSHLKGFPFYGGTRFPLKVSISISKRCSTN